MSLHVYPGDIVTMKLWRDEELTSFKAEVRQRGVIVIKHGKTVIR